MLATLKANIVTGVGIGIGIALFNLVLHVVGLA